MYVAHIIQNSTSHLAQACCALRSLRRWAITGTPIQNKLTDFASIVNFLQAYPYSDPRAFERDILKPWQKRQGTDPQGFLRLKSLVRAITISRTKSVIDLPPRIDQIHHLNFTDAEREQYESIKVRSRALLEEAISSGQNGGRTMNALWLLNILRLVCNHGLLTEHSLDEKPTSRAGMQAETSQPWTETNAMELSRKLDGSRLCQVCGDGMMEDILEGPMTFSTADAINNYTVDQLACMKCSFQDNEDTASGSPWSMPDLPASVESSTAPTPTAEPDMSYKIGLMSTKIKALVADLVKHNTMEKRYSFFWFLP
jgi:SWI/SNF-related matrix-associated actin-dependent regulator of chromatin subfamily A3